MGRELWAWSGTCIGPSHHWSLLRHFYPYLGLGHQDGADMLNLGDSHPHKMGWVKSSRLLDFCLLGLCLLDGLIIKLLLLISSTQRQWGESMGPLPCEPFTAGSPGGHLPLSQTLCHMLGNPLGVAVLVFSEGFWDCCSCPNPYLLLTLIDMVSLCFPRSILSHADWGKDRYSMHKWDYSSHSAHRPFAYSLSLLVVLLGRVGWGSGVKVGDCITPKETTF